MRLESSAAVNANSELLPRSPIFAGHQTFAPRSGWLKKGIDAISDATVGGGAVFSRPDALVTLGVGKNMVSSIRYWLLATGLAKDENENGSRTSGLSATALGTALFGSLHTEGFDPYLEDEATLWLLHLRLCGLGSAAFTWVWTFHCLREAEFSRDSLTKAVQSAVTQRHIARSPSPETISRDVECLLHTYTTPRFREGVGSEDTLDSPLTALGLLRPAFDHQYCFAVGPKPTLPAEIWAFALIDYWKKARPRDLTIPARDAWHAAGAPGRLFKLDEDSVFAYLDKLAEDTKGAYRFDDNGLVRQIVRDERLSHDFNTMQLLDKYYA